MTTQMRDVDIWLHDIFQVRSIQVQQAGDLRIERFLQGAEQLSFKLPIDDPKLDFMHEDQLILCDGDYWLIDNIEDSHPGMRLVTCNARWIELSWRTRVGPFSVLGRTPAQGMTDILQGSGWTVGTTPSNSEAYSMEEMDGTVLSILWRWAAITGYELAFDTVAKTVSLVSAVGINRQIGFRWGYNIKEIKRTFFPPPATRLYPIGANNLNIGSVNPTGQLYIENYSFYMAQGLTETQARNLYRKDLIWVDQRYLLASNLFDAGVERLAKLSQPRVHYSASVVDLSRVMEDGAYGFDPGDQLWVDDEILGVLEQVRVTRTVQFVNDPHRDEIELGFLSNGLLDVSSGSERDLQYDSLIPIVDTNAEEMTITSSTSNYGDISITSSGVAVIIAGSTFVGTASGSGVIQFSMTIDGTPVGGTYSFAFSNGEQVEFSWPTFASDVEEGSHDVQWRAAVTSGAGTVTLPEGQGRSWVLMRGAVGVAGSSTPSQFIIEALVPVALETMSEDIEIFLFGSEEFMIEEEFEAIDPPPLSEEVEVLFESVLGPTWLDSNPVVYESSDEIEIDVPSSSEEDDLILCFLSQESGASDITGPAGFTRIAQSVVDDGSVEMWSEIWAMTDDGTMAEETLVFEAVFSGPLSLFIAVIRNTEGGTVSVDDSEVDDYFTSVLSIASEPFGSVTSSGNFRMAVAYDACAYFDLDEPTTFQAPAGFTLRTPGNVAGNRVMVASRTDVNNAQTLSGLSAIHGEIDELNHAAATIMLLLQAD